MKKFAFALAALISACASVQSDYTKFDSLPADTRGSTIAIVPLGDQNGSAAWEAYASEVARGLAQHGFSRVEIEDGPKYVGVISYGAGETKESTSYLPQYGQTGGGTSYTTGYGYGGSYTATTYTTPTYGVTGYIPVRQSVTDRYFSLRIIDAERSTPERLVAAYEGSVISSGSSKTFEAVGFCMIRALMDDFRGSESDEGSAFIDDC